ncbi:ciliary microtubule inner protein 2B [Engraulis encrasicolus]|uniref:ciliary microtubule inner protein 2B n=1 Tax=Engraulis encrasicolus TaxID=184585 RepID=UPI002FCF4B0A
MQDFPPKFSKVLVTPDPQYIPGYAGYCPQLKFNLGKTYGQLTAELLTSPDVARSHSLVLNNARRPRQLTVAVPTSRRVGPRGEIRTCWPAGRRHMEHMTPGYTGFVPRSQNYFAHTYAETCREALTEFQCTQKGGAKLSAYDLPPISKKQGILDVKPWKLNTPLPAIAREPAPYIPQDPFKPRGSPYNMDNSSPHKYFISGYTGYVPKSRFLIGSGYPITTNKALVEFTHDQSLAHAPAATVRLSGDRPVATPTIYHSRRGLLPSYTGHVPGYKFRYGQTFGQLTHNTLGGADIKRNTSSQ